VWCLKKPGRDLREKVELMLAWKRVAREVAEGTLGGDFDRADRAELQTKVRDAEEAARDEVWASYRFIAIFDPRESDGLKTIDLGAGHSSSSETLCGRVIAALKSAALLNESVGAGYIERNWPPALKEAGAWPLTSLRQSFLDSSLTRLLDPDTTLRGRIVEFVTRGEFGLASGPKPDGTYDRVWFREPLSVDEVAFDAGVFLLTKARAQQLKDSAREGDIRPGPEPSQAPEPERAPVGPIGEMSPKWEPSQTSWPTTSTSTSTISLKGAVSPEVWNRLGTKVIPKLRTSGRNLYLGVQLSVTVSRDMAGNLTAEIRRTLDELGLADTVQVEVK
jgi:hypothetical protein